MPMRISQKYFQRDYTALYAWPAVLWLASSLYAVLTELQALPPGISNASPMSIKSITVLALCILLIYPVYRLAQLILQRQYPGWSAMQNLAILSLFFVGLGAILLVSTYLYLDSASSSLRQIDTTWYLLNLLVGMILMPVFFFFIRGSELVRQQITSASRHGQVKLLLRKAGPDAGNKLVRLQSADHYVELHTETGSRLLLMRLGDAMELLIGTNGLQVHRSHWVNLDEVSNVIKRNRKIWLRMSDGTDVPVSRSFSPSLRQSGVI